ncbi:hypothetical protein NC653_034045 [Populus alba x Populus x berolinensis]|uniref:Myb-like domain-containing protein n=1 Tax=Populus alba x Populus x berolinensis TaxID=444605 RepID=A0AAD6LVL5_9ROSI|nr:hypothetical protein NC653_034045 [Populus alba x Populus x berolinensis]
MVMAVSASNNTNDDNNNDSNNQEATASQKPPSTANGVPVNSTNNGASHSNSNNLSTGDAVNSKTLSSLKHDPGISVEWSPDEQSILDDLLSKYASESNLVRYAKIAMKLKDKTVRDVALRCSIGVVSGKAIFGPPLDEYWKKKLEEEAAAKETDTSST